MLRSSQHAFVRQVKRATARYMGLGLGGLGVTSFWPRSVLSLFPFANGETEVRGGVAYPGTRCWDVVELGFEPRAQICVMPEPVS